MGRDGASVSEKLRAMTGKICVGTWYRRAKAERYQAHDAMGERPTSFSFEAEDG